MSRKYLNKLSPEDQRDFHVMKIARHVSNSPDEFIIPYFGKVKDQGDVGSCVAHSLAEHKETMEFIQCIQSKYKYEKKSDVIRDLANSLILTDDDLSMYKDFSVGFIYGNRCVDTGEDPEGMIPRDALKELSVYGNVHAADFPENEEYNVVHRLVEERKADLFPIAERYRITTYARLHTIEDAKLALMSLGPVTLGIPVYSSFEDVGADGVVPMPNKSTEEFCGYHEVTIFGWRKDNTFKVLNHWGDSWGDKGWCYIPFDFIKSENAEMWSMTDETIEERDKPPSATQTLINTVMKYFRKLK